MNERGGIVTGFLLKTLIGLAVTLAVVYEGGAIIFSKVQADSISIECAEKAAEEFGRSGSTTKATEVAEGVALRRGATLVSIEVGDDDRVLATVTVRAKTLFVHKISSLRRHTVATSTNSGRIP